MRFVTYIWFIIVFIVSSCTRNKQLNYSLQAAGENKQELESVLKHFKDDPQKRKATNFLLENMSGHTGVSYSNIEKLSSVYQKYIEISQKYNWSRSLKTWQENVYTEDDSFEDFCRYILPYRFAKGLCLDNSRDVFYNRHAHFFNDPNKVFRTITDSLHQLYNSI